MYNTIKVRESTGYTSLGSRKTVQDMMKKLPGKPGVVVIDMTGIDSVGSGAVMEILESGTKFLNRTKQNQVKIILTNMPMEPTFLHRAQAHEKDRELTVTGEGQWEYDAVPRRHGNQGPTKSDRQTI